ncbi:MAG: zeta toxin [Gammaproteobacteria bacterium]|nr:MAG: zeta toxin [Gammaproteobacteria bacterium]
MSKNLYIIAGCNGAGKTTASLTILPEVLNCREFINADEIAKGLSPLNVESVSVQAGKLMIKRFHELLDSGVDFAVETTLATKSYIRNIHKAKKRKYTVILLFFALDSPELAKRRVQYRVQEGGHNIPSESIERRYFKGLHYLFEYYLPIVDKAVIYDNSNDSPTLIAKQLSDKIMQIQDHEVYEQLINYAKKHY